MITGAGSGLGLEMARHAHALGMRLVLADVEPGPLGRVVDEIRAAGRRARWARWSTSPTTARWRASPTGPSARPATWDSW